VLAIHQDSKGFIWAGTKGGLARYDSYDFKIFEHDASNPSTISSNSIRAIVEDPQGFLWIATTNGLNRFDPKTETFKRFYPNKNSNNNFLVSITIDKKGSFWIGSFQGGLYRFEPKLEQFTHHYYKNESDNSLSGHTAITIFEDSLGIIWIGTLQGGLNRFDPKSNSFTRYMFDPFNSKSLSHNRVNAIVEDHVGNIWVGTQGGLDLLNPSTGTFTHFNHKPSISNSIADNSISTLRIDRRKNLWVGTQNGGISLLNKDTQTISNNRFDAKNPNSISNNYVLSIIEDDQDNIWVGTVEGLNYFNLNTKRFNHFRHAFNDEKSLSDNNVTAIEEDENGNLWIATAGKGLNYFDINTKEFHHFRTDSNNPKSLSDDYINTLKVDSLNNLWVGTKDGGLNRLNLKTKAFTHYKFDENSFNSLSSNFVYHIIEDRKKNLWIGTGGGGLNYFNINTNKFTHYRFDSQDSNSLSSDFITDLFEDTDGNIWIGTPNAGVNVLNPKTDDITRYQNNDGDLKSLSSNSISSFLKDKSGNLWIGTRKGINRFSSNTGNFSYYGKENGLSNEVIHQIIEDNNGFIWLSTNQGLSRFNPEKEEFINFYEDDGLQSNEFNEASLKSKNGELLFGGSNGFNYFDPENIVIDKEGINVVLTDMLLFNKSVSIGPLADEFTLERAIHLLDRVILSYKESIISFEFSALKFKNAQKIQYAYKLEGLDTEWVTTTYKNRRATYTHLPSGNYTLQLKATSANGTWQEQSSAIKVIVLPPPWLSWWAYTIYSFVVLLLVYWFVRDQRKKVHFERELNLKLEQKVAERTAELEKVSLTDQLTGAHNRRFLDKNIGKEIAQLNRVYFERKDEIEQKLGFIMLDMDHFKQVNDVYGHDAGDKVLVQLVKIISDTCRPSDWVVRWGGEEFVVVAHAENMDELQQLAERIRINIEDHGFDIDKGKELKKTCSIGISSYPFMKANAETLTWNQTLNFADVALYAAKNNGRNAWISLFENNITNIKQITNTSQPIEDQIKSSLLSYGTSLKKEIDWA